MFSARYNRNNLSLVIAPTLGCNFDCIYCFEDTQDDMTKMSKEIQEKVVEFVENNSRNIDNLNVTWYGGEPTLGLDIIENLSKRFIEICAEKNISYGAAIITNGYLVSQKLCDIFKECKINQVQITIDGLEEEHNNRRPLKGGGKTFNKIVKGLHVLNENKINVSLRVNIDKTNYKQYKKVVDFIKEENLVECIKPYPGIVTPINEKYDVNDCININDKDKLRIEFSNMEYPILKSNFCGADHVNTYIVNSYGYLLSCWDEVGINSKAFATLDENNIYNIENDRLSYMLYDPTEDEYCKDCKVLPLCMGGCPYQRNNLRHDCAVEKENLEIKLKQYVDLNFSKNTAF